jgi:hypothetical protein
MLPKVQTAADLAHMEWLILATEEASARKIGQAPATE